MTELSQNQQTANAPLHPLSKEELEYVFFTGRSTAHNAKLTFTVGEKGGGSYINLQTSHVTLDPDHLQDIEDAKFTAGHEGAHEWQTIKPYELPYTKDQQNEMYAQIGFNATQNCIEDPAINDGMVRGFPGLSEPTKQAYKDQLEFGHGLLALPEILKVTQQIGRVPRYSKALASILTAWANVRDRGDHKASYSSEPLENVYVKTGDEEVDKTLKNIARGIRTAISTTLITGEEDKEECRKIGLIRFELTKEYIYPEIKKLVELDIKDEELNQAAKKAIENSQKGQRNNQSPQEELSKEALDEIKEQLHNSAEEDTNSQDATIDSSQLSEETKKELEEFLKNLPKSEQEEIKEAAKKILEDLDDAISEALNQKTEEMIYPSHKKKREEGQYEEDSKEFIRQMNEQNHQLREYAKQFATPYQLIFQDILPQLEAAFEKVKHIFKPEDDAEFRGAFPSGAKVNIKNAMQFDFDPSLHDRLFDRKLDPTKFDYEFQLIIDRSGSMGMQNGAPIEQTKRAAVFLSELLSRFRIPHQISAFDHETIVLKRWEDEVSNPEVQENIAENLTARGSTNDALALREAKEESDKRREKHKFILVFSDADSGASSELREICEEIRKDPTLILVHFGVGPNTKDSHNYYEHSFGDLPITGERSFFNVFIEVLEELIVTPKKFKTNNANE